MCSLHFTGLATELPRGKDITQGEQQLASSPRQTDSKPKPFITFQMALPLATPACHWVLVRFIATEQVYLRAPVGCPSPSLERKLQEGRTLPVWFIGVPWHLPCVPFRSGIEHVNGWKNDPDICSLKQPSRMSCPSP